MANASKAKGKTFERKIADFLSEKYGQKFIRVPNSGAFFGGTNSALRADYPARLKSNLAGDLICPPDFIFVVECKTRKDSASDLVQILAKGESKELDSWLEQVENDAKTVNKQPLLIFKLSNGLPELCAVRTELFKLLSPEPKNYLQYGAKYVIMGVSQMFCEEYYRQFMPTATV
jgi:hypothetical protein